MTCLVWAVGFQLSAIQPEHRCLADSREPTADSRLLGNVPTPEYRSRRLADERLAALPAGNMRQSDVNVKGNSFALERGSHFRVQNWLLLRVPPGERHGESRVVISLAVRKMG